MFDETFWSVFGKEKITGRTAAEVLRALVAHAGEPDLSWMSKVRLLDALTQLEVSFAIKRRGERIEWILNPFRKPPEGNGQAETIGDAIDALIRVARPRYGKIKS
jgi:hypothetical protein